MFGGLEVSERAFYQASLRDFLREESEAIIGKLTSRHNQDLVHEQTNAWRGQIEIIKKQLSGFYPADNDYVFFEFGIPRMGKRVDTILIVEGVVFVIEFKVGSEKYNYHDKEQVIDYALDLKNFHSGSHSVCVVPVLVSTRAETAGDLIGQNFALGLDGLSTLLCTNIDGFGATLKAAIREVYGSGYSGSVEIVTESLDWAMSSYKPTPTIVQAAQALYSGHGVKDISRSDSGATNLSLTGDQIGSIIEDAKNRGKKAICFVTGVPGAGKTLAGLNITTNRMRTDEDEHAVFLSGNGPLVEVLREALARDEFQRTDISKGNARRNAATFIQNIHHFRDENLQNDKAPIEKVVVFDEAQRAWDKEHSSKFMQQKRNQLDFDVSEPAFLLSVMDRHEDWCVVVALVGGGQEINSGEAGLPEWFSALRESFRHWDVHYSAVISDEEYTQGQSLSTHLENLEAQSHDALHLSVSLRSFRAEKLSEFVGHLISNRPVQARDAFKVIRGSYPIFLTRDLERARNWLREQARGSELYGLVASSGANRLKAYGLNVKVKIAPADWFLNGSLDVRSCQYLEDVATEFDIQGLEVDWVAVCWDANLRYVWDSDSSGHWNYHSFKGTKWQSIRAVEKKRYLANAYRVLLTRARQGMVIYIPEGSSDDPTRNPRYYDGVYGYLSKCGIESL